MGIVSALTISIAARTIKWLSQPDDLHILAMRMDSGEAAPPAAVFRLDIDPQWRAIEQKTVHSWSYPARQIGIPEQLQGECLSVQLPDTFLKELGELLPAPADVPLWLSFEAPSGYLSLVPWEQVVQPVLKRPLLRLTDIDAPAPREVEENLNVVVCVSRRRETEEQKHIDEAVAIARTARSCGARAVIHVHVFADSHSHADLVKAGIAGDGIELHRLEQAIAQAGDDMRPNSDNPWFGWICRALGDRSVDVIHFVCHGQFRSDNGFLAMAESPADNEWSRLVSAAEINQFAVKTGAWSVAFSSPPQNYSPLGLRQLANSVAAIGGKSVLLHDGEADAGMEALGDAYRFLYEPSAQLAPAHATVSMYCPPSAVRVQTPASRLARLLKTVRPSAFGFENLDVIGGLVGSELWDAVKGVYEKRGSVPTWLAATQRYLEQQALELRRQERRPDADTPEVRLQIDAAKAALTDLQKTAVRLAKSAGGER
jgi:hypothetical protein